MFMVTLVVAAFPATSAAEPVMTWFAPSVVTATGDEHDAAPLSASKHLKVTVTFELFQPPASGGGSMTPVMVGGVLSRFTMTDAVAVLPAKSVAVPDTT
ncbi:MAG: hypothetical protein DMF80_13405 [Acidobacteria bacterium]|nr:MAG: hypothetical protein DMF80_13405 [Acidobacteriota bacterium]